MNPTQSVAFRLGYEAYENGAEIWDNPYRAPEGFEDYEDWREGWHRAADTFAREAASNDRDKVLDDPRRGQGSGRR